MGRFFLFPSLPLTRIRNLSFLVPLIQGWDIFQAFQKHCRLPEGGFASILDVDQVPVVHEDRMETFWLAETLKYLYLLFSEEELLPLDQYVFNTEVRSCFPLFFVAVALSIHGSKD